MNMVLRDISRNGSLMGNFAEAAMRTQREKAAGKNPETIVALSSTDPRSCR
jgi:hypothetical protein